MIGHPLNALCNSSAFIKLVRFLNLRALGDQILQRIPWIMKTSTGISYRLDRVEAVFLAETFFWKNHRSSILKYNLPFESFADIGSNRGYFTLYLMHLARQQGLVMPRGICVDANQNIMRVAESNFRRNGLNNIWSEYGFVGTEGKEQNSTVEFFLSHSDMESSRFCLGKKVSIPVLNVEKVWIRHFGNEACQLLKLDIEGSEYHFLNSDGIFMKRVKSAIIEFHEPMSMRKDVESKMLELGFECLGYEAGLVRPKQLGALYFKRTSV